MSQFLQNNDAKTFEIPRLLSKNSNTKNYAENYGNIHKEEILVSSVIFSLYKTFKNLFYHV